MQVKALRSNAASMHNIRRQIVAGWAVAAAAHESACGPTQTSSDVRSCAAIRGKADLISALNRGAGITNCASG